MENQSQSEKHPVLGGKAYLYRRSDSQLWQAAAYLKGRNYRNSTQETHLHHAIKVAEEWYLLFPSNHSTMFDSLLKHKDVKLKYDRDGKARTSYSLRHTYICMRLLEGADIYQIAKNCRTSVEMIEKHYAAHLKNTLDASAINVVKTGESRVKNQKKLRKSKDDPSA